MDNDDAEEAQTVAERVLKLADELEASGDVKVAGTDLEIARAVLHKWIDTASGFVVMPALGRVTIIHDKGRQSTISSAELPYAMSIPIKPLKDI